MTYTCCPACNGKRREPTDHPMVFECRPPARRQAPSGAKGSRGAVYGDCTKGESYGIVLPYMAKAEVPPERCRYYDLTVLGSDGLTRRHGWFDPETRRIVQIG